MRRTIFGLAAAALLALGTASVTSGSGRSAQADAAALAATPVVEWSNEARRAIGPAGPGRIFGAENYGNTIPGEAGIQIPFAALIAAGETPTAASGSYTPRGFLNLDWNV